MRNLIIVPLLVLTSFCQAQVQETRGPIRLKMPPAKPPVAVLAKPEVQKELRLTRDQANRVSSLPTSADPEGAYVQAKKILSPAQVQRLNEVYCRLAGLYAATYAPNAKTLGLSAGQQEKILSAFSALIAQSLQDQTKNLKAGSAGSGPVRLVANPYDPALTSKLEAECKPLLTPHQWRTWTRMIGRPVAK